MPSFDLLAFPFAAGLVAAFNPCGFAMLPTYLTYFLGLENDDTSAARALLRGGKVGLALTLGFLTVFAVFGVLFEVVLSGGARSSVQSWLWVVTIGSGVLIFVLGAAMLRGFQPVLNLPKIQMGTGSRETGSVYLFGVSYGLVSLGCTIGPFLIAVTGSVANTDAAFGSLWAFVAYALGMGAVIVFLTMALAAGRSSVANRMRSLLPKINRISGGLLLVAGVYLVLYGQFQRDPINNGNSIIDWVEGIQADVVNFINNDLGAERAGLVMLVVIGVLATAAVVWKQLSKRATEPATVGDSTAAADGTGSDDAVEIPEETQSVDA
ncbi:MAG: cytochrome c biogenesis CcdA family protein [Acidimicrobiales bacterium]